MWHGIECTVLLCAYENELSLAISGDKSADVNIHYTGTIAIRYRCVLALALSLSHFVRRCMSFGTQFVHLIHLVSDRWAHEFMLFASLFYIRNTHKRTDIQTLVLPQTHKRRTNVIKLVPKWITQAHYSVELNIYNEPYNLNEYEKKDPKMKLCSGNDLSQVPTWL